MNAIKAYLLRLILCGFLVSLTGTFTRGKRAGKVLALCGGCLLILTALRPLLRVDLTRLPDLFTGLTKAQRQEQALERNNQILRSLVEEQTVSWLKDRAEALGLELRFSVSAREAEAGSFVPDSVEISGVWTAEQRERLSELIASELAVPPEKQRWVGG